ncbi:MAG: MoaD/ThiS family protein [Deltaproteobacteria bacterium]|nr:MoaD/ThiS family protein [Deltaproteobacteria bacterium]
MDKEQIRIKLNSCYSIGRSNAFRSRFASEEDFTMVLASGTTVEDLLLQIPGIGKPEEWDDLDLHVFVNHKAVDFDGVLADGDVVDIHIPSSGG